MVNDGSNMKIGSGKGDDFHSSKAGPSRKPKRDFRKVMAKEEREGKDRDEKKDISKEDKDVKGKESYDDIAQKLNVDEMKPKKKGISLFELASVQEAEAAEEVESLIDNEELPVTELSREIQEESLSALFKGYGSKERLKAIQEEVDRVALRNDNLTNDNSSGIRGELPAEPGKTALTRDLAAKDASSSQRNPMEDLAAESSSTGPKTMPPTEKGRQSANFVREQSDLSSINPLAVTQTEGAPSSTQVQGSQQAQSKASQLQEILDQIIDKLYTVNTSGKTDMLIKLKHPPLFAGSSVVISSFKTAKGEFNITFENLTQAAKQMLDMRENQNALKLALDQKGYTVHIITTTTLTETLDLVEGNPTEREKGEQENNDAASQDNEERKREEEKKTKP